MGKAGKEDSAPTLWLTAIVHLRYGLLWAWRLGKGTASEQMHLIHLLATLPARSLLVTDAGYIGYELLVAMTTARCGYLIRMSSRATLFTEDRQPLGKWRQGLVWYWPQWAQEKNLPPLRTPAAAHRQKSRCLAVDRRFELRKNFRMRQRRCFIAGARRNEGLFRTYKRTISGVKFRSPHLWPKCIARPKDRCWPCRFCWLTPRGNCVTTANRKRSTSARGGSWC